MKLCQNELFKSCSFWLLFISGFFNNSIYLDLSHFLCISLLMRESHICENCDWLTATKLLFKKKDCALPFDKSNTFMRRPSCETILFSLIFSRLNIKLNPINPVWLEFDNCCRVWVLDKPSLTNVTKRCRIFYSVLKIML